MFGQNCQSPFDDLCDYTAAFNINPETFTNVDRAEVGAAPGDGFTSELTLWLALPLFLATVTSGVRRFRALGPACFHLGCSIRLLVFLRVGSGVPLMLFGPPLTSSFWSPVFHPVECSYCHCESMMGFRYRCQQCHNYQLCQNCFWRGHANGTHSNQHQMKEHSSWVTNCSVSTLCLARVSHTVLGPAGALPDREVVSRNLNVSLDAGVAAVFLKADF